MKKNYIIFITLTLSICIFLWLGCTTPALILEHIFITYYTFIRYKNNFIKRYNLNLTMDEFYILEELALGKYQKEIKKFSKNTVSKKLKQARERNKVSSTAELVLMYRENYLKDTINPIVK